MPSDVSFRGLNSGLQLGQNNGHVSVQFQTSTDEACLRDLRTTDPRDDKSRIEQTKGGLLEDSYRWILDNDEFQQWRDDHSGRLLWIKGDPGKGKTMLLCGIIDELTRSIPDTATMAFFFCQAADSRINTATAVLRGLIYSLVERRRFLLSCVRSQYDRAGKQLFEDINSWHAISRMFTNILQDSSLQTTYLIVDALDECRIGLPALLHLIVRESSTCPHVKWIVSSRNWPEIEEQLETANQLAPISLELNEKSVSHAVSNFIQYKVDKLAESKKCDGKVRETICQYLSLNAQGTFLWVALVCKELTNVPRRHLLKKLIEFPPGLNALYARMMDQIRDLYEIDAKLCMRALAIISTVYRPLTLKELKVFLCEPNEEFDDDQDLLDIISRCGSFLTPREGTIRFIHQSAQDFLTNSSEVFPQGIIVEHHAIFARSLQFIVGMLRRDIYNIGAQGPPAEKIRRPNPDPLAVAHYACVYWVDHLQDGRLDANGDLDPDDRNCVDVFLRQKYLHWLEALSLLGEISRGITAMLKLEGLLQNGEAQALFDRVRDASRFIRYNRQGIESDPFQIYSSALIFSPMRSVTRTNYQKEIPDWILNVPEVLKDWTPCLQALEGHSERVKSVVWSPDGSRLASASDDHNIRIWDSTTGQCQLTLEGHSDSVWSIVWSPDGRRLVSISLDKTARIWNLADGFHTLTLEGPNGWIRSISWSKDGIQLASVSSDNTVKTWDCVTGQCTSTLEWDEASVDSGTDLVAWSPDGGKLALGSWDKTVRIWDLATGRCIEGDSDSVDSTWSADGGQLTLAPGQFCDTTDRICGPATGQCIEGGSDSAASTCSPDGTKFASTFNNDTGSILDPAIGQCESTLQEGGDSVDSIAWSPDGSQLASALNNDTVGIFDPVIGGCEPTLGESLDSFPEEHRYWVEHSANRIAWSHDGGRLASVSIDSKIRIWDFNTGHCVSTLEGHGGWKPGEGVTMIAWSPDGRRLASALLDGTIRIWDSATSECELILEGHSQKPTSIAWSPIGNRLASAFWDGTIGIWDSATGRCVSILKGHGDMVLSVAWSHDGSRLASGSSDKTVRIWDITIDNSARALEYNLTVEHIAFSPNGGRLASISNDNTIRIWDPATGQCKSILDVYSDLIWAIAWLQDGSRLASASYNGIIKVWDSSTGQCLLTIQGSSESVFGIVWSPDGSRLASSSRYGTVRIWDSATGQCEFTLHGKSDSVNSIAWSPDGHQVASASSNGMIEIWDSITGQCVSALEGHSASVKSVVWSPDGRRLASASRDATVTTWDALAGRVESMLEGHSNSVDSIAWSQDGSRLASASSDGTVKIWTLATSQCESTLNIRSEFVRFDKVNSDYLHTTIGLFDLGSIGPATSTPHSPASLPQQHGYGTSDDYSWITYDGVKLLWLPPEYRPADPSLFAISETKIVIYSLSDHLMFIALSEQSPFPGF